MRDDSHKGCPCNDMVTQEKVEKIAQFRKELKNINKGPLIEIGSLAGSIALLADALLEIYPKEKNCVAYCNYAPSSTSTK